MSLHDEIAKLPPEPKRPMSFRPLKAQGAETEWTVYFYERAEAALTRLALDAKLAKEGDPRLIGHNSGCFKMSRPPGAEFVCTCGRDDLLKALEAQP